MEFPGVFMKKYYRLLLTAAFLFLFFLMLSHPAESLYYAFTGLTLWFQKMIPTLFPFMILSGMMVRMNLTEYFAAFLVPVLKPVFRTSANGIYCIFMGFLCGFPMGAKVIADLYERKKLTRQEAQYLLSFCNNIGPIYFMSFVLPLLGFKKKLPFIIGMYGIPLCYGVVLSHIQKLPSSQKCLPGKEENTKNSLLLHIDDSIMSGIESITKLGGYMVLFNLLNLLPAACLPERSLPIVNGLLEITSGISRMGAGNPFPVLMLLPFGGLSCMAQTYSIIKNTDLSIGNYFMHKVILTAVTAFYYLLLYQRFPLFFTTFVSS